MGDLSTEQFPHLDADPRRELSDDALREASRNAYPIVAGDARRRDRGGLILGGGIALALGAITFLGMSRTGETEAVRNIVPSAATSAPTGKPPEATKEEPGAPPAIAPPTPAQAAILAKPPATLAALQPAVAPVMVFDQSTLPAGPVAALSATAGKSAETSAIGATENEAFGTRVGGEGVQSAAATRLVDPGRTVTQGTLIPAILETAIDSDLPGYVRAVVSQDVRSFDGKRVLVPRSSRLIGQYKSGLNAGQTRAYVMWTRLIRPDGVSVALASPAIEYSGRSGLAGNVDGHFFQRFGAASLLSVIGGIGALASGGASLIITSGSSSAAAVAAQRDAQIPPTIRVAQGQPIRVFTARDLDFSGVAP